MKDTKEGASAAAAGSLFQSGIVRGEKVVLKAIGRCRVPLILVLVSCSGPRTSLRQVV